VSSPGAVARSVNAMRVDDTFSVSARFTMPLVVESDADAETESDLEAKLAGFEPWVSRVSPDQFLAALHADIPGHGSRDDDARAP
jgi:hypothetical protein